MSTFASQRLSWWEWLTLGWAALLAGLLVTAIGLRVYAVGLVVTAIWDLMELVQRLQHGVHASPLR